MPRLFFLSVILFMVACRQEQKQDDKVFVKVESPSGKAPDSVAGNPATPVDSAALEDKVYRKLLDLEELKKADEHIRRQTGGKSGIAFMKEESSNGELFVRAGLNGKERFETYFQFYVNLQTLTFRIYDPVSDRKMTMEEYRRQAQD